MASFQRYEAPMLARSKCARRWVGSTLVTVAALSLTDASQAAVVFSNGFESGSVDDWDYALNPEGLSVVTAPEPVLQGTYALRAELTEAREWSNGIFRTEVQHRPETSRVSDGAETYFGWSIYLPNPLPEGDYQFGYFETRNTYDQVFSLHAEGSDLALYVNTGSASSPSSHPGALEPGKWHRIVFHVKWSSDRTMGFVSLWWDGVKLVEQMTGKTYLADPALVQLGLLKNPPAPPEPIVLYVDEVMEGDSYDDVSLGIPEGGAGAPVPTPSDTSSIPVPPPTTDTTAAPSTSAPVPPAAPTAAPEPAPSSDDGGGCTMTTSHTTSGASWLALIGLTAWGIRRAGCRRSRG